jgi:colanic acid biosynthesis glycosyl transferase WcaI
MAGKQGLELLPAAAREAEHALPGVYFVMCGDGVCKPDLERESEGLSNMRILPLQPIERLGELLNLADIHLLPQHADAADLVMPSKLTGMLSSGRPVLATANAGTELARVVQGLGLVVPPDNLPEFMVALARLAGSAELRAGYGAAARAYAEDHLARDRVLVAFEKALMGCVTDTSLEASTLRPQ